MAQNPTIYFICGAGLGSSLACQMETEEVLVAHKIRAKLEHESVSSVAGLKTDVIVSAESFRPQIEKYEIDPSVTLVYLHNIVDKTEIAEKLLPALDGRGA
ncbi:PTS sugar transporter subunit IIB [Brachybacterium sacelli]|uniref:PTS system ascorbate-specific IIB component n=1 Tax=Brachybacterium sacelli TaxID=173364 RepID=A0ABS4WZC4_9MICO|nr:PTS sugar transporter subunit IIB [Brachybacterium sacelli]MBP2381550.1 PTS system ascorbate-specific IIB component [Brachybacterium sacelli]